MRQVMQDTYDLDDATIDRIVFVYKVKIGRQGNEKMVSIDEGSEMLLERIVRRDNDPAIPGTELILDDLEIKVRHRRGDMIETDCNCDSAYMLTAMHRVGKAIRSSYSWVPRSERCYLVMDNAGGHGTNEAIDEYVAMLRNEYNVETIFQIPRSPYTNVLDLGAWCALQSRVEKQHFGKRCEVNALSHTVMDTWNNGHLDEMITKVFLRLKKVLVLIVEANGKNDLVEQK